MTENQNDPAVVASLAICEHFGLAWRSPKDRHEVMEIIRTAYAERERQHAEVVRILNELYQSTTLSNDGQRLEILVPSELAYAMRDALDAETERLIQAAKNGDNLTTSNKSKGTAMPLSFETLRQVNANRCVTHWHALTEWSPTDWATAMGGECGEALNLIKKLRRATGPTNPATLDAISNPSAAELIPDIGKELADLVIYADLLASRLGLELGKCVQQKFNETSDKIGSAHKL